MCPHWISWEAVALHAALWLLAPPKPFIVVHWAALKKVVGDMTAPRRRWRVLRGRKDAHRSGNHDSSRGSHRSSGSVACVPFRIWLNSYCSLRIQVSQPRSNEAGLDARQNTLSAQRLW